MMKMLIELNNELIENDGYSIEMMWAELDAIFAESNCTKNIISNTAVVYESDSDKIELQRDMIIINSKILNKSWFFRYALKWTIYENNDNNSNSIAEVDGLAFVKKFKDPSKISGN